MTHSQAELDILRYGTDGTCIDPRACPKCNDDGMICLDCWQRWQQVQGDVLDANSAVPKKRKAKAASNG